MKRDETLLLALLEHIEARTPPGRRLRLSHEDFLYPPDIVEAHFRLLLEARLIRGVYVTNVMEAEALTWDGHERLASLRRDREARGGRISYP